MTILERFDKKKFDTYEEMKPLLPKPKSNVVIDKLYPEDKKKKKKSNNFLFNKLTLDF